VIGYQLTFLAGSGPLINAQLYYQSNNCTGQPFVQFTNAIPGDAQYDGQSFWGGVGALERFYWQSFTRFDADPNGRCSNNCAPQTCVATFQPAARVETRTFSPPFKMQ
jgi:hypothetical protein